MRFISIIDNDSTGLGDKVSCFFPICFRIMFLNDTSIELFFCHLFKLFINKKKDARLYETNEREAIQHQFQPFSRPSLSERFSYSLYGSNKEY